MSIQYGTFYTRYDLYLMVHIVYRTILTIIQKFIIEGSIIYGKKIHAKRKRIRFFPLFGRLGKTKKGKEVR